jgi:hypothetical protein
MISVLVPYRPDEGRRDELWSWIRRRNEILFPDAEIIEGASSPGPFNRSEAVNDAASRARGDLFVIADADMAIDPAWWPAAIECCAQGDACYHASIHYLTEADSDAIVAGPVDAALSVPAHTEFSSVKSWGGVCMLPRAVFELVRGMDARFVGWGPDDAAFALALTGMWRTPVRLSGDLIHLWHPAPPPGRPWGEGQNVLLKRYQDAVASATDMAALLDEKP